MIFRPFFFISFCTLRVEWVGFEKCGKFRTFVFFFETFPNELSENQKKYFWFFTVILGDLEVAG